MFWRAVREGVGIERAAAVAGVSKRSGWQWVRDGGGMPSISLKEPSGRYLSFAEREQIALGLAAGESLRSIARRLGRSPSTVSRELRRHGRPPGRGGPRGPGRWRYLASSAQEAAQRQARRPKPRKLATNAALRAYVETAMGAPHRCSPAQVAARLVLDFPDDEGMRISPEAIYQTIYVQGRGELRRELAAALRSGRAIRRPQRRPAPDARQGGPKDMVNISERPPEVADRAVPGHWEGDLIVGANSASYVGTLVERQTRFVMLLKLTNSKAATVREAIATQIMTLPAALRRSLTWDQGAELAEHVALKLQTGLEIYFCDPKSPWQRGSNENTNRLLRDYLPKGTSLRGYSQADLDEIAFGLNGRPRQTLGWRTPAEAMAALLSTHS